MYQSAVSFLLSMCLIINCMPNISIFLNTSYFNTAPILHQYFSDELLPQYWNPFCVLNYVRICVILSITATNICFNTSSLSVAEDLGMVVFALNLSHQSSIDITITITSSDITTNGEVTVMYCIRSYILTS